MIPGEALGEARPGMAERTGIRSGGSSEVNVGQEERLVSAIGGGALALYGIYRRDWLGAGLALLGAAFVVRGATGHCPVYEAAKTTTVSEPKPLLVDVAVTIDRPADELFRFWHHFENVPRFMHGIESVTVLPHHRSHWVARDLEGKGVEWDAELVAEKRNALISWRALTDSEVPHRGSVRFEPATRGRGTEVRLELEYGMPGGVVSAALAKLMGKDPESRARADLRRFKSLMEAGEIPTTTGQPSGSNRRGDRGMG